MVELASEGALSDIHIHEQLRRVVARNRTPATDTQLPSHVPQGFLLPLSNKVFSPSRNSVLPCIQQILMFFEHPCTHLNTHCERMMGKSRSRHDNSSLSCSTACGDHHEGPLVPVPKSDDFI